MASPAPVFGDLRLCLLAEPFLLALFPVPDAGSFFESNSFTVSLTLDFRLSDVEGLEKYKIQYILLCFWILAPKFSTYLFVLVTGLTGGRAGEGQDSFDSSLFGREIGLGMRDFDEDADKGRRIILALWPLWLPQWPVESLQTQFEQQQWLLSKAWAWPEKKKN